MYVLLCTEVTTSMHIAPHCVVYQYMCQISKYTYTKKQDFYLLYAMICDESVLL